MGWTRQTIFPCEPKILAVIGEVADLVNTPCPADRPATDTGIGEQIIPCRKAPKGRPKELGLQLVPSYFKHYYLLG